MRVTLKLKFLLVVSPLKIWTPFYLVSNNPQFIHCILRNFSFRDIHKVKWSENIFWPVRIYIYTFPNKNLDYLLRHELYYSAVELRSFNVILGHHCNSFYYIHRQVAVISSTCSLDLSCICSLDLLDLSSIYSLDLSSIYSLDICSLI